MASAPSLREQYDAYRAELARNPPRPSREFPERTLSWLALAPSWPAKLVRTEAPGDRELLDRVVAAGLAHSGQLRPPYEADIYWMDNDQRTRVLRDLAGARSDAGLHFLSELNAAAVAMEERARTEEMELSPPLQRWLRLARSPERHANTSALVAMANELDEAVTEALDEAARAGVVVAPEVHRWISTMEPLALAFAGPLEVALARTRRRLELFHRRARDEQFLKNYQPRPEPERAFRDLLFDGNDAAWALHIVGQGGMGKTMLLRRLQAQLGRQWGLATAGVDFDYLHRDYPTRAPGLLLSGLAEELRLWDDKLVGETFGMFDVAIVNVHKRREGLLADSLTRAERRGVLPARPLQLFVEALRLISQTEVSPETLAHRQALFDDPPANLSSKVRIVLILDTCEELARIRVDGTLPDNVAATFDVLEAIQNEVSSVRVVFSGRRPLARRGHGGWECDVSLPERKWLRRFEIQGFTRQESLEFLGHFRQQEQKVPPALHELMLSLSVAHDPDHTPAEPDSGLDPEDDQRPHRLSRAASEKNSVPDSTRYNDH